MHMLCMYFEDCFKYALCNKIPFDSFIPVCVTSIQVPMMTLTPGMAGTWGVVGTFCGSCP